jgi:hypothetical protein
MSSNRERLDELLAGTSPMSEPEHDDSAQAATQKVLPGA